jgi:hypothetical protein
MKSAVDTYPSIVGHDRLIGNSGPKSRVTRRTIAQVRVCRARVPQCVSEADMSGAVFAITSILTFRAVASPPQSALRPPSTTRSAPAT